MPTWSGFGVQSSVSVTFRALPASADGARTMSAATTAARALLRMVGLRLPGDEESLGEGDERVQAERKRAQDEDGGEDARGLERGLCLQDDEAEPGGGAGPFSEDGADRGIGGRDAGAGEDCR